MNTSVQRLLVKLNNNTVGYLEALTNQKIVFQYAEEWVKRGFSISPFSLPLSDKVYRSTSPYFNGLFGVFQDSLPDGWGERLVRKMLNQRGVSYDKLTPLSKLSLVGNHGLGGLTYEPSLTLTIGSTFKDSTLDELAVRIEEFLNNYTRQDNLDELYALGGASGGARPKVHKTIHKEDWIIKFPATLDPQNMGVNEYRANQLARDSGLRVNEFALFPSQCSPGYFGAKRFDMIGGQRMHVIALSSLLETTHQIPNLDYTHLFQVIQKICVNQEELYEAFKRMSFNVLYKNRDDHGKNTSFIYDTQLESYILSPAYDITQTNEKLEHEMTVLGQGQPTKETLYQLGKTFHLSAKRSQDIIKHIETVIQKDVGKDSN